MRLTASRLVCQQAVELASDYVEGSLSRRDRRRFEKHLADCDACTEYLEQLRFTTAASGSIVPDDLSPEVLNTLTNLFRTFHDEE
ncbi:MAG: anti-sigma factor family protein [Acidimicrobiales bacterium]